MSETTLRCAIYTRKSSEEGLDQDFNSLDAQREACEAYIASQRHEGWKQLAEHYDDGGISGGTLERPALQRLLTDIDAGRVDLVVFVPQGATLDARTDDGLLEAKGLKGDLIASTLKGAAMQADGDELLSESERAELLKAIESLIELRNGDSADAIEQGIKDTDKASQEFASRRMDKSIRAALSGQSVNDI